MKNIRHTGIVINDLDKELRFYRDILGLKVVTENTETGEYIDKLFGLKDVKVKIIKLKAGDGNLLELLYHEHHTKKPTEKEVQDTGYSHISFTVDSIDHEYKKLKDAGIKFNYAPQIAPHKKAKVAYFRDPENNFIELVEELENKENE